MSENDAGAIALLQAVSARTAEIKKLKQRVSELEEEIKGLKVGYKALTGKSIPGSEGDNRKPVLDWVEEILREKDPNKEGIHVDLLIEMLKNFKVETTKQTVSAGLIRFHNQGKRFIRTDKNTFALRD